MTSTRKINANRANAQASTGPRTKSGKARAALNARRHGLSLSVTSNPVLAEQVETLAREFAGKSSDPEIAELAHDVAEAQIDLVRIRLARLICWPAATSTPQVCNSRIRCRASTGHRITRE